AYIAALGDGSTLPAWLSFDGATRTFSGTPPQDFDGSLDITITASDGTSSVDDTFSLTITPINDAPVITSNGGGTTAAVSVAENTQTVTIVAATDVDDDLLTYSIAGGADEGLFTIDPATGLLSFTTAPDYETPTDTNGNNVYEVIVHATDGQ